MPDRDGFDAWVATAAPRLHRTAYLLIGDWALAQDLVQHACVATWPRFGRVDSPDAYARRVMVRTASSWWRRRWRGEVPHADVPETPGIDQYDDVDRRTGLTAALAALPQRQRAVVVLRFYEDLSEAETAAALGWPAGTVKSTTARALSALRAGGLVDPELHR